MTVRLDGSEGKFMESFQGFRVGRRVVRRALIGEPIPRGSVRGKVEAIFWERSTGGKSVIRLKIKRDGVARADYHCAGFWEPERKRTGQK